MLLREQIETLGSPILFHLTPHCLARRPSLPDREEMPRGSLLIVEKADSDRSPARTAGLPTTDCPPAAEHRLRRLGPTKLGSDGRRFP